jgi:hypothetical protein
MMAGGAYVKIAVVIKNRRAVIRFARAIEEMRQLAEDSPWMTDLAELADELEAVKKELICVPA